MSGNGITQRKYETVYEKRESANGNIRFCPMRFICSGFLVLGYSLNFGMDKTELINFIKWYAGSCIHEKKMKPEIVADLYIDKVLGIERKSENDGIQAKH